MRKVLLATTALVALGGVSAASADISVSGSAEFQYDTWTGSSATSATSNDSNIGATTDFAISASTVLDNGWAISARTFEDGSADGTASFAQNGFSISGDFGKFGFASDEDGDKFATALDITDDEGYNAASTVTLSSFKPSDEWISDAEVSYLSPSVSGFQFSVGMKDGAYSDTTVGGFGYTTSAGDATVTIKYAFESAGKASSTTTDGTDETSLGLVLSMGGATLTVAQQTSETGTSSDYEASGAAIAYAVSDSLSVQAFTGETDDNQDSTFKFKETGYGLTYTITPGLSLSLTSNTWDQDGTVNEDGTNTALAIDLSF